MAHTELIQKSKQTNSDTANQKESMTGSFENNVI